MGAADNEDFDLIEPFESGDSFGHHSVRDIRRGLGQSAVKSAAYITGQSLHDDRVGLTFGRPEKQGRVLAVGTVGPKGSSWTAGDLWGAAEAAETKSNARTAQTREVGLPSELDEAAHKRLLNGYTLWLRDEYGVAGTWALHAPSEHGDARNIHGHINTTTRAVAMDAEGRPEFGAKVRALSGDRKQVAAEFEKQRAEWARRVNAELEKAGSSRRLDHRSHARRAEAGDGPALEPSAHKGARQAAKERKDPKAKSEAQAAEQARKKRNTAATAEWKAGAVKSKNRTEPRKRKPWESDTVRLPGESREAFRDRKFNADAEAYEDWTHTKAEAAQERHIGRVLDKEEAKAKRESARNKRAIEAGVKKGAKSILSAADEATGGSGHVESPIPIPSLTAAAPPRSKRKAAAEKDETPDEPHDETAAAAAWEATKAREWEAAQAAEEGEEEDDRDGRER